MKKNLSLGSILILFGMIFMFSSPNCQTADAPPDMASGLIPYVGTAKDFFLSIGRDLVFQAPHNF